MSFVLGEQKQKWFNYLIEKEGRSEYLMKYNKRSSLIDRSLVALQVSDNLYYSVFEDHIALLDFMNCTQETARCFFEIILGERRQKPHFDIDVKAEDFPGENIEEIHDLVIEELITACIIVLQEVNISIDLSTQLLMYSSHGPQKRSTHLLLGGLYHNSNREAKAFYLKVIENVNKSPAAKYSLRIDPAVYSSTQQFRLLGSHKYGTTRTKCLVRHFQYKNEIIDHTWPFCEEETQKSFLQAYQNSLVTFVSNCKYIPSFIIENPHEYVVSDLSDKALEEIEDYCGVLEILSSYKILKVDNNRVDLQRTCSSYCEICHDARRMLLDPHCKPHTSENAYLTISGNNLYFHCRRDDNRKLHIGYVSQDQVDSEDTIFCGEEIRDENREVLSENREVLSENREERKVRSEKKRQRIERSKLQRLRDLDSQNDNTQTAESTNSIFLIMSAYPNKIKLTK